MSTHWGYACISHDPPLLMDDFGGVGGRPNHAFDAMVEALAAHRQGTWPREEPYPGAGYTNPVALTGATGCESAAPLYFLDQHPRCRIAIFNEYGDTWFTDDGVQQVAGHDERRSHRRVPNPVAGLPPIMTPGVYPPEGETKCSCYTPTLAVTHPSLNARGTGWVRCTACGGLSLPEDRG